MKHTLPATKVRAQFFKILQETERPGSQFTITVDGEPKVVMIPAADFEGWMETLEIMSDKKMLKEIREGLKDKKRYTLAQIKKEMRSR